MELLYLQLWFLKSAICRDWAFCIEVEVALLPWIKLVFLLKFSIIIYRLWVLFLLLDSLLIQVWLLRWKCRKLWEIQWEKCPILWIASCLAFYNFLDWIHLWFSLELFLVWLLHLFIFWFFYFCILLSKRLMHFKLKFSLFIQHLFIYFCFYSLD